MRLADELIAAQYADRPHPRRVLDTLLAAVPALGPVTVQARKTFVSLVTPRRTFAVVQATTKRRVDLGPARRSRPERWASTNSVTIRAAAPPPR